VGELVGCPVATDLIADTPDRADEGAVIAGVHLAAKVIDIDVHDIRHGVEVELPDLLDDGRPCDRLSLMPHQEFEKCKFLGTELDRVSSTLYGVGYAVDLEITDFEHSPAGTAPAAENSADARGQFRKRKRLRQGVIGAGIEQAHSIFRETRTGHHENGQVGFLGANMAKNVEPGFGRQIEIQNYKIVRLVRRKTLGFPTVRDHMYGELFLLQPLMEKFRQRRVIFSDKNAHRLTPNIKFGRG
jgi:hypothetical protein